MKFGQLDNVAIITKQDIGVQADLLSKLAHTLKTKYHKAIRFDIHSAPHAGQQGWERKDLVQWADLIITLGGDGTILKTAREIEKRPVLILGVNFGTLGFLTELSPQRLFHSLKPVFEKKFVVDERFLLRVSVYRKDKKVMTSLALNDAVINQGSFARLITLRTEINQRKINSFKADGLIIATPTGSTGHSLSAGGPIVHPKVPAFVMTPICPASLSNRPIVIPNDRQIKIVLQTQRRQQMFSEIGLTLDGQVVFPLEFGDHIKITTSSRRAYMIRMTGGNYYKMLRSKLHWGLTVTQ